MKVKTIEEYRTEAREIGEIVFDLQAIQYDMIAMAEELSGRDASARFNRALARLYRERWAPEAKAEYEVAFAAVAPPKEPSCPPSDTPSMEGPSPQ